MASILHYCKPCGGHTYLVKWGGRWRFYGTGAARLEELKRLAERLGRALSRHPGPRDLPATVGGMRERYPSLPPRIAGMIRPELAIVGIPPTAVGKLLRAAGRLPERDGGS